MKRPGGLKGRVVATIIIAAWILFLYFTIPDFLVGSELSVIPDVILMALPMWAFLAHAENWFKRREQHDSDLKG